MWFKQTILYQKAALTERLAQPMAELATRCAPVWTTPDALDEVLREGITSLADCHLLYALDTEGLQLSANITRDGIDQKPRGQTLAGRPYQTGSLPFKGLTLSTVYVSDVSHKRCLTGIQAVTEAGRLLGFIAADFNLDDLPLPEAMPAEGSRWTQYKGDPAIRSTVFQQQRMRSALDERVDEVIATIDTLMQEHGVFHFILHFSSSRAIFWVHDDPYNYRFHSVDEILDPEIWLAYPPRPYPAGAKVAPQRIRSVLQQFKYLREADENIYLRQGSLNVMNGIIGLTFSCDGSHYLSVDEFLDREHPFWA